LVDHEGKVSGVRPLDGEKSASLPALIRSVEGWRFSPVGETAKPAIGSVLLIKGEDQFRYETSIAFRDSGSARLPPAAVSPGALPTPGRIVTVQVKLSIDPDEAKKQLIEGPPPEPEYPASARRAGTQGTVLLGITIGVDGSVTEVRVIGGPPELTEAAVAAVKRWRYRPTMVRGIPRESVTTVEIRFQLPG
jgi:TonB family protein